MRIISGFAGGRPLRAPSGSKTRPTSDRVREALFSILGSPPDGCQVLDLFAGSGGLGLEALSRGAKQVVFVERDKDALQTLRHNIRELQVADRSEVIPGDSMRALASLAKSKLHFDWIFLDPPYASDLACRALTILGGGSLLRADGDCLVVVEHDKRSPPGESFESLIKSEERRYGDTCLTFYERIPA